MMQRENRYEFHTGAVRPGLTYQLRISGHADDELYQRAYVEQRCTAEYPERWEVALDGVDECNNPVHLILSYTQIKELIKLLEAAVKEERRIREEERAQYAQEG